MTKFPYSSKSGHEDAVILEIGGDLPEVGVLLRLLVLEEADDVSLFGLKHERSRVTESERVPPSEKCKNCVAFPSSIR